MSALELVIEPVDTWFFRDGQPYVKQEPWQADIASRFPPSPATLVGAVRAALARSLGWSGRARDAWAADVSAQLGDGDDLGPLTFRGPLLWHGARLRYPAPAALLAQGFRDSEGSPKGLIRLRPGDAPHRCDLGRAVRLPVPATQGVAGAKPLGSAWIDGPGLAAWLRGETPQPESVLGPGWLWQTEERVGIVRDEVTRTTGEGALYSPRHVRLRRDVRLWLRIEGLAADLAQRGLPGRPHPLGGESRMAWITPGEAMAAPPDCPPLQPIGDCLPYSVLFLTPAALPRKPEPGERIEGLPGRLVSACLPPPTLIGGWDSRRHTPLPLQPHLAPGSVLFMSADANEVSAVKRMHGACIGKRQTSGFGWILIGAWS